MIFKNFIQMQLLELYPLILLLNLAILKFPISLPMINILIMMLEKEIV